MNLLGYNPSVIVLLVLVELLVAIISGRKPMPVGEAP